MDPKECLQQADQFISNGDYVSARIRLSDYWRWRAKHGFEPFEVAGSGKRGDDFARDCKRRLDDAMGAKPTTYSVSVDAAIPYDEKGFTSLDGALLWAMDQAKKIERSDEPAGEIYCEDTAGNTWDLVEDNGGYVWEPADVVIDQYPIVELPPRSA